MVKYAGEMLIITYILECNNKEMNEYVKLYVS